MAIKKLLLVDNCCACASSSAEYTVALVCPNPKEIAVRSVDISRKYSIFNSLLQIYAEKHFNEKDWKKIADDEDFNDEILRKVQDICRKDGCQSFEIPKRIKVVQENWSPESGLVNDALKLKRKAIGEKYKDDIKQMYREKSGERKKPRKDDNKKQDQSASQFVFYIFISAFYICKFMF